MYVSVSDSQFIFPCGSADKESAWDAGDSGLTILQYSPWGHKELDMTERLSLHFSLLANHKSVFYICEFISVL